MIDHDGAFLRKPDVGGAGQAVRVGLLEAAGLPQELATAYSKRLKHEVRTGIGHVT